MLAFRGAGGEPPGRPHDVGHACVTTGRRGISMPTFLTTAGSHLPATPTGVSHLPFQSFS